MKIKKFTITTNDLPINVIEIDLPVAKKYIRDFNLTVIKVEEHIKDPRYANVVSLQKIDPKEVGL